MKKTFKVIIACLLFTQFSIAQKKEDRRTLEWKYEVECAGIAPEGYYMVKVFTYSTNRKLDMEQAKKNAVHGVLFKGYAGNTSNGCATVRPICMNSNIEFEKKEFFDTFFANGGKFMKFVTESNDAEAAGDRAKVGKLFKVGVIVMVAKDLLRKDLEAAGIINGLKGF